MKPRQHHGLLLALLALAPTGAHAFGPHDLGLPLPTPSRNFLLLHAEQRTLPGADARVRVQLRGGGPVTLSVYRLHDPSTWLAHPDNPDGLAVADTPAGRTAESLHAADGPMPRAASGMTLVRTLRSTLRATAARRTSASETEAYDSNDADEGTVETRWVHAGRWADTAVSLGALPAGLYLVRAHVAAYAANTLLAVSDLTLVARRGDHHDLALVADASGRPMPGVAVQAWDHGTLTAARVTDARGEARFGASDVPGRRFVAWRDNAWAWTDVRHARFDPCDPRVYLDTGRPVFRPGETLHLRGHVRGCRPSTGGREGPLAGVAVQLYDRDDDEDAEARVAEVRTDAQGDFVAEFVARTTTLRAVLLGRSHGRTIVLDSRALPRRALRISLDRAYAVPGETVQVRAHDDAGGWVHPASVTFSLGEARTQASAAPGQAAVGSFVVPPTDEPLHREIVTATLSEGNSVTMAQTELWVGRSHRLVHVSPVASLGTPDGTASLRLRVEDLGGTLHPEPVTLTVFGSDGNRPVGAARWSATVQSLTTDDPTVTVHTPGTGPWWVRAQSQQTPAALGTTVLWDRPRAAELGAQGSLSVVALTGQVVAGQSLPVALQRPPGATWVTLEQSGVWSSAWVAAAESPVGRAWRTALAVPTEAQGGATVVATHFLAGAVTTATSATRVEATPPVVMRIDTGRRTWATGERMRVTVSARSPDGTPRDGVISLWMADAGYWDMATDSHPAPDAILALPGRPASAGDSTHPRAWGADEGRLLDPMARFNGELLPTLSPFDLWTAGGEVVSLRAPGGLSAVARALAARAGLQGAVVCPAQAEAYRGASLEARDVPWDLLAARIADASETHAWIAGNVLQLSCTPGPVRSSNAFGGLGGAGTGSGYGSGYGGQARHQELRGDLFFLGTRRLGPTGQTEVEIPLPDHPGRWRVQGLVLADGGRGDRAHAVVTTTRTLEARVELPTRLRVGDTVQGAVSVRAPSEAGQTVTLALDTAGLTTTGPVPTRIVLDAQGEGRVTLALQATTPGAHTVTARVEGRTARDAVQAVCDVRDDTTVMPLALRWTLGESAADLDLALPPLRTPGVVTVRVASDLGAALDEALDTLAAPHWRPLPQRAARLAALATLASLVRGLDPVAHRSRLQRLDALLAAETVNLLTELSPPGAPPLWERHPEALGWTATALDALGTANARMPRIRSAWMALLRGAPQQSGDAALTVAYTLASRPEANTRTAVAAVLDRIAPDASISLAGLRAGLGAAQRLHDAALTARWRNALAARVTRTLDAPPVDPCAHWWWVCLHQEGPRGAMARAALSLDAAGLDLRARVLTWLGRYPSTLRPSPWTLREADEADVIALYARGLSRAANVLLTASVDGRAEGRRDADGGLSVPIPLAGGRLRVSAGAQPGRVARVQVDAMLPVAPLATSAGTVPFLRTITDSPAGPTLALQWTLPRASTGVTVTVPLPAGVAVARPGGRVRMRANPHAPLGWSLPDEAPETRDVQVVALDDDALTLRIGRLDAGVHRVTVPLVRVGTGSFGAGGARLVCDDPGVWALTAPVRVEYPPRP